MSVKKTSLNGKWELKQFLFNKGSIKNLTTTKSMVTNVPGDIHPTLVKYGIIPDPYFGTNIEKCKWTNDREWWFVKIFYIKKLEKQNINLVFDGIDTYGTVFLNNKKVGITQNMFLQYKFDVKNIIRPGWNNLVVKVGATAKIMEQYNYKKYFACFNTPRIFVRKAQCHFSWDWAPHLPALGIWQNVYLEQFDDDKINNVYIRTKISGDITFIIELNEKSVGAKISVRVTAGRNVYSTEVDTIGYKNFVNLKIPNPKLWWPNGIGEPFLYEYNIKYKTDSVKGKFGIREVELVEKPLTADTISFTFKINGQPVFCKGANWIPADCFPGTINNEKYKYLLTLTKTANFNILRVWGGGIYEKDVFYDLCDELGIMVWQDFMFACSDYPDDDNDFVNRVKPEIEYQVKRLRNHPSIIYWCGGNEKTGSHGYRVKFGDNLFHTIIRGICNDLDTTRPYRECSPYSLTDIGNTRTSGDTHGSSWEKTAVHNSSEFHKYINSMKTSFNSEFAIQGPVVYKSFTKFLPEDKLWPPNEMWEYHVQDNPYNELEETFTDLQLRSAEKLFGKFSTLKQFIKHGSAVHSELMRFEIEHYRRRKFFNSGAMFWMFADCWPCSSWAVIDYFGEPKPAYYSAKRYFQQMILSIKENNNKYEIYGINDNVSDIKGDLVFGYQNFYGKTVFKYTKKCGIKVNSVVLLAKLKKIKPDSQTFVFAKFRNKTYGFVTTCFNQKYTDIKWIDPNLKWEIVSKKVVKNKWILEIRITSQNYARYVNIDIGQVAVYSDNFFDILPKEEKNVIIEGNGIKYPDINNIKINHWLTDWE